MAFRSQRRTIVMRHLSTDGMLIGVVVMLMVLVLVLCAGGVCCVLVLTLVSLSSGVDPAKTAERNTIRHAISVFQCKIRSLKIEDIINDQLQCTRLTTKRTELAISILEAFLYSAVDAPKCLGVRL